VHSGFALQLKLLYGFSASTQGCDWHSKRFRQRTDHQHIRTAKTQAREHSPSSSAVRRIRSGRTAKNSQRLRVIHDQEPAERVNRFHVCIQRRRPSTSGAKTVRYYQRSQAASSILSEHRAQSFSIMMRKLAHRSTTRYRSLDSPASDRVGSRVNIDRHGPTSQQPEYVPEEVQRRAAEQAPLATLQSRQFLRYRLSVRRRGKRRRHTRSELRPLTKRPTRMSQPQVQRRSKVDHGLTKFNGPSAVASPSGGATAPTVAWSSPVRSSGPHPWLHGTHGCKPGSRAASSAPSSRTGPGCW
jgi:hypothetical protein